MKNETKLHIFISVSSSYNNTIYPYTLKTIDIIHNSGLRVATGAFRSSPIPRILSTSGEPPLHIRRIKLALNYIARILSSPENSTLPFLTQNRFANTFFAPIPILKKHWALGCCMKYRSPILIQT